MHRTGLDKSTSDNTSPPKQPAKRTLRSTSIRNCDDDPEKNNSIRGGTKMSNAKVVKKRSRGKTDNKKTPAKSDAKTTYKVESITGIRQAYRHTPEKPKWQYAVKWVGYGARTWQSADMLNNYPLLAHELSLAIMNGKVYTFPAQKENNGEGQEVDEMLDEEEEEEDEKTLVDAQLMTEATASGEIK